MHSKARGAGLAAVKRQVLVLLDAGYDAVTFLRDIAATRAQFICRRLAGWL